MILPIISEVFSAGALKISVKGLQTRYVILQAHGREGTGEMLHRKVIIADAGSRYSLNPPTPAELMIPNTNMNNASNIPAKDAIST